jgi:hypothetical protein
MNHSARVFAVLNDGSIKKLANNKFYILNRNDKKATFPEFSNRKLKIAEFIVELENRKPIRILYEFYNIYFFDEEGRIDDDGYQVQIKLLGQSILKKEDEDNVSIKGNVIDATNIFLERRIETQYKWHPDESMKNMLYEKVFR